MRRVVFIYCPAPRTASKEIDFDYDELVSGSTVKHYIYLNGMLVARIDNGVPYYYHTDHLGTPQAMTDAAQAMVWNAKYEPFGKVIIKNQTVVNNIRLPGQYFDQETGLHQNRFRDYDPKGRYIQFDPIGLADGTNGYVYVVNNPLRFTDPLGLFCGSGWNDPFVPDSFPGGVDFSNACKKHDTCYEKCGASKHTCDQKFLDDTLNECSKLPRNTISRSQCQDTATLYWESVGSMGQGAFDAAQKNCQQCTR